MDRQVDAAVGDTLKFRELPKALCYQASAATSWWPVGKLRGMVTTPEMLQWVILSQATPASLSSQRTATSRRCNDFKGVGGPHSGDLLM